MKRLSFSIILILLIIAASDMPQAKVTGVCSNCHTMHNSQGGGAMAYDFSDSEHTFSTTATPKATLLIYSCVGCHTNVTNVDTIDANNKPFVFNPTVNPVDPLAGGNFYYVTQNQANGHNVVGIFADPDSNFSGDNIPGSATSYAGNQVTCAGTKGCHGDRGASDQLDAMKGAHHTNDAGGITAASIGLSYRFLDGILGTEDDDWEQNDGNTTHNEYKGAVGFTDTSTISSVCGQCHGDFHSSGGVGSNSPWLRHPTDIVLPSTSSKEYQYYNGGAGGTAATAYSMLAPLARPDLANITDTSKINPGTDIVMCLSCHRAHGSPNYKMIRWNNKENMTGCVVCHTSKN